MVSESTFERYRFVHSRRDHARGGMIQVDIIAVAQSPQAARAAVGEIMPEQGLALIDQGQHVLEIARRLGIGDGEAKGL
jgi:hypothetical protein